jgi:hypothetical protein
VPRVLSTAFCVALLAATAGAFALTEGAKTELSPIYGTTVDPKVFSPTCNLGTCRTQVANIDFKLRKREHIAVWMERDGKRISTIVPGRTYGRGPVRLVFDGISDSGLTLPDGTYVPVIRFTHEHRTLTLPNKIVLDTQPPKVIKVRHHVYAHISPDGDGRKDVFRVPYTLSEAARAVLLVDHRQVELVRFPRVQGVLIWNGKLDGHVARPGNYLLEIAAQDAAGNRSKPFPIAVVTVRYLQLGRTRVLVRPGRRFAIRVLTDSPTVSWLLDRGRGSVRSHTLRLRAPAKPGVYRLYVTASGHTARALVVVG